MFDTCFRRIEAAGMIARAKGGIALKAMSEKRER
jgi:hypothetical protein